MEKIYKTRQITIIAQTQMLKIFVIVRRAGFLS